jgi:hypothetical protein
VTPSRSTTVVTVVQHFWETAYHHYSTLVRPRRAFGNHVRCRTHLPRTCAIACAATATADPGSRRHRMRHRRRRLSCASQVRQRRPSMQCACVTTHTHNQDVTNHIVSRCGVKDGQSSSAWLYCFQRAIQLEHCGATLTKYTIAARRRRRGDAHMSLAEGVKECSQQRQRCALHAVYRHQ